MKMKAILAVMMATSMCVMTTACNNKEICYTTAARTTEEAASVAETSIAAETTTAAVTEATTEAVIEAESTVADEIPVDWETISPEDVDSSSYEISGGTWFYNGIEDEKSIDMDGLKGFTAYTPEAIPETEGYLQYLGVNPDGLHVFDVYDIFGKYFTTLTFTSDERFYVGNDENEYYVKWDY